MSRPQMMQEGDRCVGPSYGRAGALLCLILLAFPALAQPQILDGDSLKINGTTYRLHGIDAPEMSQICENGWMAGAYAAAFLRQIIEGRKVECEPKITDRYGRTVALCRADNWDLGSWMVRQGMAHAFTRYSRDYVEQEKIAKDLRIGIHAAGCVPAWEYRQKEKK
jgi:endonuclease YncB( thermonuclease family)